MEEDNLSISALAARIGTGRTAVRRILDAENTSITFRSMSRAAHAVGLKIKLIASIVAFSGIHLLKRFMNIGSADKDDLFWLIVVHMTFVLSGLLLALMDWVVEKAHRAH
jgi:uncharacterized protein (TIGR00645 family)